MSKISRDDLKLMSDVSLLRSYEEFVKCWHYDPTDTIDQRIKECYNVDQADIYNEILNRMRGIK